MVLTYFIYCSFLVNESDKENSTGQKIDRKAEISQEYTEVVEEGVESSNKENNTIDSTVNDDHK